MQKWARVKIAMRISLDVGCNVDLYVANHESADLLYEEQVGDASSTSNESGQDFVQFPQ